MSEKDREFDSTDWSNMLNSVCRWKPEEWYSRVIGGSVQGPFSKKMCEESGWPSIAVSLGRGLVKEDVYESTYGINLFQDKIQDQWSQDGYAGYYYDQLATERGCADLAYWMNANKNLCLDKERNDSLPEID